MTLITDTPEIMKRAIDAGCEAHQQNVPGFLGLHLEGPHLSIEKRGAHHPDLIRPMTDRDVEILREARRVLPNLMVTLAPEAVEEAQITELTRPASVSALATRTHRRSVQSRCFKPAPGRPRIFSMR